MVSKLKLLIWISFPKLRVVRLISELLFFVNTHITDILYVIIANIRLPWSGNYGK